jgi:hypothetical protein
MDIHKPKPWHSLREFLKEYLIIVIGVLTALAAEQAVEWAHWQERTERTEANLRAELHDMALNAQGQLAINKCSMDMVDRIEKALVESGDAWTPPFVFVAGSVKGLIEAPKGGWDDQVWRNAQADGSANHLPQEEQLAFGSIYVAAARLKTVNEQEQSDMAELNSLGALPRIDTQTRAQYLRLVWRVRDDLQALKILSQGVLTDTHDLKVKPAKVEEYNPQAMGFYQRMCREFYSGKTVIPVG